jgi:hypothetical protein
MINCTTLQPLYPEERLAIKTGKIIENHLNSILAFASGTNGGRGNNLYLYILIILSAYILYKA